jgi:hypothetical protein
MESSSSSSSSSVSQHGSNLFGLPSMSSMSSPWVRERSRARRRQDLQRHRLPVPHRVAHLRARKIRSTGGLLHRRRGPPPTAAPPLPYSARRATAPLLRSQSRCSLVRLQHASATVPLLRPQSRRSLLRLHATPLPSPALAPPAAAPLPLTTPRGRAARARRPGKHHAARARRGREVVRVSQAGS